MGMIDFTTGGSRFYLHARGVAIAGGHVLLHRVDGSNYWLAPGGRVEFGETSSEALVREMREEIGQDVRVERLLWTVESVVDDGGFSAQCIGLIYAIGFAPGSRFPLERTPFTTMDGAARLDFAWLPLNSLDTVVVYPPFLRAGLRALPASPAHVVDDRR